MSAPRYLMKSVPSTMRAHGGFEWPCAAGVRVAAPDWDSTPRCGGGLHGALNGAGSGWLFCWDTDAVWIVAAIPDDAEVVDLDGKVKVSHCDTVVVGTREDATRWLVARGFPGVIGATLTGGNDSTLTGGHGSVLTGGIGSTLVGGDCSTLTGGYGSTLTGGYDSTLTGGNDSTLTGGDCSTLTGGYGSTLTGGNYSTLTGGDCSTLTGGYDSTLTGGDCSTLTGGIGSTLTGGIGSTLIVRTAACLAVARVGDGGLTPGVRYRVVDGSFVEVED